MSWLTLKDGEQLFYQNIGSGRKTVVMVHGWASSHEIYSRPVELMKEKARFIIYDLRGHGESKDANKEQVGIETLASDLNELITTLGLKDINLFGWSMGGAVALKYIDMYGCGKIKQTIICDMSPKQLNDAEWKLGSKIEDSLIKEADDYEKYDFYTIYKDFSLKSMPELIEVPKPVLDRLIKMRLDDCDETVLRSLIKSLDAQDNRAVVKKMNVPLVYFYANPGSIFSPKLVNWYRENTANKFRSEEFEGNHMFIMDKPDIFAQKLVNVLL